MRYSFVSAAILALSSSVFAQTEGYNAIVLPIRDQKVPAGKPFEIVWQPGQFKTGTASITLLQGATEGTLQLGETIATGVKNTAGKYTWNVPADVPKFAVYGFQISKEDDASTPGANESLDAEGKKIFQYSFPFHITGAGDSSSSAAGGDAATTTIKINTGPAYTPEPTTTATPSANSTSTFVTSTKNTTIIQPTPKPSSNYTLTTAITTIKPTASASGPIATAPAPPVQTANSAMTNAVSGGMALIGGVFLAFAL